jgi:hypothetical protein
VASVLNEEDLSVSPELLQSLTKLFARIAATGVWSDLCLQEGFLPVPVSFYSPIPNLADLQARRVWEKRSSLPGVDFREEAQVELVRALGDEFGRECAWPLHSDGDPTQFFTENGSFSFGCAAALHCMIRRLKPKRVIEIGSGNSTKVIAAAQKLNREDGADFEYTVVDPYPGKWVDIDVTGSGRVIKERVELLEPGFFDCLGDGDILFIDSGHTVRIGGDVNFLYLDVLPRLAPGVVVHVHDIHFPYEYPKAYATNERFRQFWTEQYLLQSFLACNDRFEVLLGMYYLMTDQAEAFREAFKAYNPNLHQAVSGSFWMRRKAEIR